jgi:ribokinase
MVAEGGAAEVVVVGQVARDLVLRVGEAPRPGGSSPVRSRREMLGGKGANQAVALSQLGTAVALIGVVGGDDVAPWLLDQAERDGIDVSHVVRRRDVQTALLVDVVDDHGQWRYLEHVPGRVLTGERDVVAASRLFDSARAVVVQLQQPSATALCAARLARAAGALVVLDGVPDGHTEQLLGLADIVRADTKEAELLTGTAIRDEQAAARAGADLLDRGPSLAVLDVSDRGNAFVTPDRCEVLPLLDVDVVDTTGCGDALVATLTAALLRGEPTGEAARLAVAASAITASHAGGRPQLSAGELDRVRRKLD